MKWELHAQQPSLGCGPACLRGSVLGVPRRATRHAGEWGWGRPAGRCCKALAGASWGLPRRRGAPGARGEYGAVPLHRSKRAASGVVWSRRHSPSCSRPFSCAASPARCAGGAARGTAAGSRPGGSHFRDPVLKMQVASGRRVCCRWWSNSSCKQVRGSRFWLRGYSGKH